MMCCSNLPAVRRSIIRSNSDWIARYGGEEFLIVLPETPHAGAVLVAEKIRQLVASAPFATRAGDTVVTASFGVASTGPSGPDLSLKVETLIRAADESLYKSKLAGRNCSSGQELARGRCTWRRTARRTISRPGAVRR